MPEIPDQFPKSLAGLSELLLSENDAETTLQRVAEVARELSKHCDAVSVTLVEKGELTTAASTTELARQIDAVQYDAGEGPCVDASDQLQVFNIPSLASDTSWPAYTAAAIERGVMSSLSLPLTFGGQSLGAINLYSSQPHAFDECREAGLMFAAQAGVAVIGAQLRDASQELVQEAGEPGHGGDVITRAKNILMEQKGCTAKEALETLRQRAQAVRSPAGGEDGERGGDSALFGGLAEGSG